MNIHVDAAARAKLEMPEGWEPYRYEWVGDHILIEGGVPRVVGRGPNKGSKRWDRCEVAKVVLSRDDIEARETLYERTTGKCHRCEGSGRKIAMSSTTHGNTYKPCGRCDGSGAAPGGTTL